MSESKKPPPRRTSSGENPAVRAFRDKLESIQEGTFAPLEDLNARLEKLQAKTPVPPRDPRREEEDDSPIREDVVELPENAPTPVRVRVAVEPDPFPSTPPPKEKP
jgi:hypothetical protein